MTNNFLNEVLVLHARTTDDLLNQFSGVLADYSSPPERERLYAIVGMIMLAHSGDTRRLPDISVNHILRVTLISTTLFGYDYDIVVACLLHDLVEDYPSFFMFSTTDNIFAELTEMYGNRVASILEHVTNPPEVMAEEESGHSNHSQYHSHLDYIF